MAKYTERYRLYYTSPMRDKRSYCVVIEEKDYLGAEAVAELYSALEGLVFRRGARDASPLSPILASDMTMTVVVTDDTLDLRKLYDDDPAKYRVTVYAGDNITVVWQGYISTGQYSQPFARAPYRVTINATDGLGILQTLRFMKAAGERYTGNVSLRSLIDQLLLPIVPHRAAVIWGLDNVGFQQPKPTADLIGVTYERIYSEFDNIPSYYEVLEKVLGNFSLQVHQRYGGGFSVRPVFTLAEQKRPAWYKTSLEDFGVAERPNMLALVGNTAGEGMSSTATLSIVPPLKSLALGQTDFMADVDMSVVFDPARWRRSRIVGQSASWSRQLIGDKPALRVQWYRNDEIASVLMAATIDGVVTPSAGVKWVLSMGFVNYLWERDAQLGIGVYAINAAEDPTAWIEKIRQSPEAAIVAPAGTAICYPGESSAWYDVGGKEAGSTLAQYSAYRTIPAMVKGEETQPTTITFEGVGFPDVAEKMRLCVYLCLVGDKKKNYKVGLMEPSLSIEYTNMFGDVEYSQDGRVEYSPREMAVINTRGTGEEAFMQPFPERGGVPSLGGTFAAGTIRVDDETPLMGYIAPTLRARLSDIVTMRMRQLRGRMVQMLDGEVYSPVPLDLDTVWHDDEGNRYYTAYVEDICRRGLARVQMLQLPSLWGHTEILPNVVLSNAAVPFDTSILFVRNDELVHLDIIERRESVVAHLEGGGYSIVKGVSAACVCEPNTGAGVRLRAYDEEGNLLSVVDDVWSSVGQRPTADMEIFMLRSARYDRDISTWTIIGNMDGTSNLIRISVLDRNGVERLYATTEHGRLVGTPQIFAGGFAYSAQKLTSTTIDACIHSYLTDEWWSFSPIVNMGEVVAVTDSMLIIAQGTGLQFLPRRDKNFLTSGQSTLPDAVFYHANNYAVVGRRLPSGRPFVYIPIKQSLIYQPVGMDSIPLIVGDKIVYQKGENIIVKPAFEM